MSESVVWNGTNTLEVKELLLGSDSKPVFVGKMNGLRLVLQDAGHGVTVDMYDKLVRSGNKISVFKRVKEVRYELKT